MKNKKGQPMNFDDLIKIMPICLQAGLDWHKTIDDLHWLAQHELDLYYEGEESDIVNRKQLRQALRFKSKCYDAL